jgi:uncharacterized protein (TIGR00369 family)
MTTLRSAEDLTAQLHGAFPAMAEEEGRVDVEHVDASTIRIRMRAAEHHLRPGATVSGPALFSLVDTVAWLMTLAHLEPGRDALTVSASVQFLRRPAAGTLIGEGRLLRMGRRFSVTDVLVRAGEAPGGGTEPDGTGAGARTGGPNGAAPPEPVVQATVTYAPI